MSSFIQWPTIYGSAYFLPGILVVVLLLALLLLMSSRRRSAAERARLAPDPLVEAEAPAPQYSMVETPATAPAEAVPAHGPGIVTQPVAMMTQPALTVAQPVAMVPQPVAGVAQPVAMPGRPGIAPTLSLVPPPAGPAPVAAVPLAVAPVLAPIQTISAQPADVKGSGRRSKVTALPVAGPGAATVGGNDPMNATIQDILNGWGDLAPEDMKRLELFRPGRLSAALATVQLPKSSSTETKMRLSELRRYAGDLEQRAHTAQVAAAAARAEAAAAATPEATSGAPAAAVPSIASGAPVAAPVPVVPAAATAAFAAPALVAPAASTELEDIPVPVLPTAASFGASKNVIPLDDPSSFWADPRPLWEPDPGASFEEIAAPTYHEIDMDTVVKHDLLFDATVGAEARDAAGNGHGAGGNGYKTSLRPQPVQTQPVVAKPHYTADDFFWDDEPVQALSRLSLKIETAEQLLALPAEERADMAAFLPPAELVAAFRATYDPDLKKAVIDTLEHIGSPASLNALGNCFEDADSDIQTYALAAADRLLGVA